MSQTEELPQLPTVKKLCQDLAKGDFLVIGNCACPVLTVFRVRTDVLFTTTPMGVKDKPHTDVVCISYLVKSGAEAVGLWRCEYGKPVDVLAVQTDTPF